MTVSQAGRRDKVRKDKMEFSSKRLRKYYKNMFRNTICCISIENGMANLIGNPLNLLIALGGMAILTISILPIQEHGLSLHFTESSSVSFINVLQFLTYKSFIWFTVFRQFLLYSQVTQSCISIYIYINFFFLTLSSYVLSQVTRYSYLCYNSRISLLIHSKCISLHLLTPNSQSILFPTPPSRQPESVLQVDEFVSFL